MGKGLGSHPCTRSSLFQVFLHLWALQLLDNLVPFSDSALPWMFPDGQDENKREMTSKEAFVGRRTPA